MNFYEQKKASKLERAERRLEKAQQAAENSLKRAREIGSHIPMGQPILVGHHSEKRHRRDLEKIDRSYQEALMGCQRLRLLNRKP